MSDFNHSDHPLQLFPKHFEHASRLRSVWRTGGFLARALQRTEENRALHQVLLAMIAKQLRQLSSVRELTARGEASDASLLLPSMFETLLAVGFVTKPKWELVSGKKKTVLSQELRCAMVLGHTSMEKGRLAQRFKGKSQDPIVQWVKLACDALPNDNTTQLGKEGTKILSAEPFTFSGNTLQELAAKFGSESVNWYDAFYGELIDYSRGPMAAQYLKADDGALVANWTSSPEENRLVLEGALKLTHSMFALIDKHCDVGYGASELIRNLAKEFDSIREGSF